MKNQNNQIWKKSFSDFLEENIRELPDNFKEIALKECDYNRGPFGLTEDGRLYIQEWTIFPDDPDHVYVVFDTIFRGEYDEDYIVVAFPVHAFNDKDAMKEFVNELEIEYDKKQKAEQRKRLKEIQKSNFQKDFSTQLHDERNLRIEQSDWKRLRKKYLPEEFNWIVEAFIKRGILEKEHKQDYINYYLNNDFSIQLSNKQFHIDCGVIFNEYEKFINKVVFSILSI